MKDQSNIPNFICAAVGFGVALLVSLLLSVILGSNGGFGLLLHVFLAVIAGYLLAMRCMAGDDLFGLVSLFEGPKKDAKPASKPSAPKPAPAAAAPKAASPAPAAKPAPAPVPAAKAEAERAKALEGAPPLLMSPRSAGADDLKRIKGVGPKLEGVLNELGVYHFDQIAAWTEKELEWVDNNIGNFSGRAVRDDWIGQAKALSNG